MQNFELPLLIGLLIESVVFYVDTFAVKRTIDWRMVAALVTGIAGSLAFGQDVYAAAGMEAVAPFVGSIFTGVLFSRMANFSHDVIQRVRGS